MASYLLGSLNVAFSGARVVSSLLGLGLGGEVSRSSRRPPTWSTVVVGKLPPLLNG